MYNHFISSPERSGKEKRQLVISVFRRFMPYMLTIIPLTTVVITLSKIISALFPIAHIYITKELIDTITQLFAQRPGVSVYDALYFIILQAVLIVLERFLFFIETITSYRGQQKLKYHIEQLLINKSSKLPLSFFDRSDYYDQLEKAAFGVDIKGFAIFTLIINVMKNIITLVGIIGILFSFHWALAVAVLIMLVPNILVNSHFGKLKYNQMVAQTPTQRKAHYLLNVLHGRAAAKELRVYSFASYLFEKWKSMFWTVSNEKYDLEKRSQSKMMLVHLSHSILDIAVFTVLIIFGSGGALTIGHYVSLSQAIGQVRQIITGLGSSIASIYEESLFVSEVLSFLDLEDEDALTYPNVFPDKFSDEIKVDNLHFTYASGTSSVLKGISFTIKAGETVAIVGENGAGKSTLVKCLLGLYTPSSGKITVDGIDLTTIPPQNVRKNMSAVFQDYVSYQMTARENIGMGHPNMRDDAYIEVAATKSGIDKALKKLSQGWDSELGPMFNNGHELSGGQWQKIALSRAFMQDAQIFILDEPTASLDPRSESEIFENFSKLCEGKTTIMISHRLGSCINADKIIVLSDGGIIEEGNHRELMALGGAYSQMFNNQASRYVQKVPV